MERTFILVSKLVIHRNTIKSTCTQNLKKNPFGSKKYLTSRSFEVQKAQDQAPKHTASPTALFAPLVQRKVGGWKAGQMMMARGTWK